MEMIRSNSEALLAEFLPRVAQESAAWLGVHINLSPLHEQLLAREGLSHQSLGKTLQMSQQIAGHMMGWGLKGCQGKFFVFEDSDLLCLLKKDPAQTDTVIARLKEEFQKSNLLHLLHFYEMKDRLATITALSTAKRETADNYRFKHRAIALAGKLLEGGMADGEATQLIQGRRRSRGKSCILVVEDDVLTRGMLATLLKQDHQVVQAKDARDGIVRYIDSAPDVVFLDIHLPDISGNQVLRHIRALDPQAYVVMLSSDSIVENIETTRKCGAAGFVCKPFTKEKILDYVKQCPLLSVAPITRALGWRKVSPS